MYPAPRTRLGLESSLQEAHTFQSKSQISLSNSPLAGSRGKTTLFTRAEGAWVPLIDKADYLHVLTRPSHRPKTLLPYVSTNAADWLSRWVMRET
jgi:hypothetical protein